MIEQALYTVLKLDAGVAAICGARIYSVDLPQEPTFPAVVFWQVSTTPSQLAHDGFDSLVEARYQFDCCAETSTEAKQLRTAVRKALNGFRGVVGAEVILDCQVVGGADVGAVEGVYQVSVDVLISHRE